jgi:voltage-gated potassium channel Kch
VLIFSSLIYYADDRKTFTSIPHSFWWALITMTTVGYGDMYPVTEWGYVIGSLTAMSGLLMIGFSLPILVNNFIMYYQHVQFALEEEKLKRLQLCFLNVLFTVVIYHKEIACSRCMQRK